MKITDTFPGAAGLWVAGMLIAAAPADATIIWGNGGSATPEEFDVDVAAGSANLIKSFVGAAPGSGKGVAVLGSSVYYTVFTSGSVFLTDTNGANLGVAFNT